MKKKCGHTTKLTYTPPNHEQNNVRRKRQRKIIWFNPPVNLDVSNNLAKIFLNLIEKQFPRSSKLHKIFNKNIIKVSYSCTQTMSQIIKAHNKEINQKKHKRRSSLTVALRQIVSPMVIPKRRA